MRWRKTVLLALVLVTVLVSATAVMGRQTRSEKNIAPSIPAVSSYYNGNVFTGTYLRLGLNDYGVLGIYSGGDAIGFQYPPDLDYESLATGWWGDAWSVFYNSSSAGFSPDDDAWGTISGSTPTVTITPMPDGILFTSIVDTTDGNLRINTTIRAYNSRKYFVVIVNLTNIGDDLLSNVEYKRHVDWDVWEPVVGDYDNYWGLDNIRAPALHLAVAFVNTSIAPGTVYMGLGALQAPDAIDLDWDDYTSRGISGGYVTFIQPDGTTDTLFDGAVVYDWLLGDLSPGDSVSLKLVYAAGDTLEELETSVSEGLGVPPYVGGELILTGATGIILVAVASLLAVMALAATLMRNTISG